MNFTNRSWLQNGQNHIHQESQTIFTHVSENASCPIKRYIYTYDNIRVNSLATYEKNFPRFRLTLYISLNRYSLLCEFYLNFNEILIWVAAKSWNVQNLLHAIFQNIVKRTLKPRGNGALARGDGTNSARLFTPEEKNALAKSKVHQISWAGGHPQWSQKYVCLPGVG